MNIGERNVSDPAMPDGFVSLDSLLAETFAADVTSCIRFGERPDTAIVSPEWWERMKKFHGHMHARNRAGHRPAWKRARRLARLGL